MPDILSFSDGPEQSRGDAAQSDDVQGQREGPEHGGTDASEADGEETRHFAVQRRSLSLATVARHMAKNELRFGTTSERERGLPGGKRDASSSR